MNIAPHFFLKGTDLLAALIALSVALCPAASTAQRLRIVNGHAAEVPPWLAALSVRGSNPIESQFCGGVLVSPRLVVTAAHCAQEFTTAPEYMQVVFGRSLLSSTGGTIQHSDGIIIHPKYDSWTQENDIALVRLSEATSAEPLAVLTPAEESALPENDLSTILGWGSDEPEDLHISDQLQEALVPVASNESCAAQYGEEFKPGSMLCAGILSSSPESMDGVDTCYGDSGGPLLTSPATGGKLRGLTSWGIGCASSSYWGIYTRVSSYASWITEPHTIRPFIRRAPFISGLPHVGSKLSCEGWELGGDPSDPKRIQFKDLRSGRVLSRGQKMRLSKADLGKTVYCQVGASNSGGSVLARSNYLGPIYPRRSTLQLRSRDTGLVESAGVFCLRAQCALLVSFTEKVRLVKGLLNPDQCTAASCRDSTHWISGRRMNRDNWNLPLLGSSRYVSAVELHAAVPLEGIEFTTKLER